MKSGPTQRRAQEKNKAGSMRNLAYEVALGVKGYLPFTISL